MSMQSEGNDAKGRNYDQVTKFQAPAMSAAWGAPAKAPRCRARRAPTIC
jgi:hypothetical protein